VVAQEARLVDHSGRVRHLVAAGAQHVLGRAREGLNGGRIR
jgi:hypothetical protein